mmetsp:Transcript_3757/g.7708  ORF Transcript_3757/g.7708 Transcript_3757/m.7708 type:complete len:230 (-) Transcript_3757:22-711(-)|eukprot:CAMPEP_0168737866 /NCGR_PEP_ID=MMETSP0724-20121128/10625_1 /TAXON_ID=265536 /ORGANISM="Amphiprora sp., Strain CCMP467" /LENGTH=229 /DNA_ID=CAMNT_0008785165 /DNA_START=331 /DNA_END=1020 /DNA_ORIENTATION=-
MGRIKTQSPCTIATLKKVGGNHQETVPEAYHCTRPTPSPEKKTAQHPKAPLPAAQAADEDDENQEAPTLLLPPRPKLPARRCLSLNDVDRRQTEALEEDYSESTSTDSPLRIRRSSRVSFTNLEIRSYPVIIGDHPCCTLGCSVSLGWEYESSGLLSLEDYEAERPQRRSLVDLRLSAEQRQDWLLANPHNSPTALRRASRKLHRARSCVARIGGRMNDAFFHGSGGDS